MALRRALYPSADVVVFSLDDIWDTPFDFGLSKAEQAPHRTAP